MWQQWWQRYWRITFLPEIIVAALRESVITTLSAQLLVWPIIAHVFGRVSVMGLVVNPLLLWLVPGITIGGMVISLLTSVWPAAAVAYQLVLYWPLSLFVRVVRIFSQTPGLNFVWQFRPDWWFMGGYFLLLLAVSYGVKVRQKQ